MSLRQQSVRVRRATPQQQAIRSADAALSPSAVQRLQRTIGNRAVGQVLRQAAVGRTSPGTSPVQRVGGEKIGFSLTAAADATIKEGQDLLLAQWRKVRQSEHDLKVGTETTDIGLAAQELITHRGRLKEREKYRRTTPKPSKGDVNKKYPVLPTGRTGTQGFSKYYHATLTGRNRAQQLALLKTADAFGDGRLAIDDTTGEITYQPVAKPAVVIGTLKRGEDAFTVKTAATSPGQRDVLEKQGVSTDLSNASKEYVKDSRGVLTRRYAYVEKNYWQMMEFFTTNRHEGRFQTFMKAAGDRTPNIFEARHEDVDIVRGEGAASTTGKLTKKQMAVAHQKLGSGPQQRGVSLASTPKVGATYVNTGENFRTKDGFRLKVDLALIPLDGPLLINHYSHGGVSDKPDKFSTQRDRRDDSTYPYKESALHARELYLEYLKPEWVVAIEAHPAVDAPGTTIDRTTPLGTATSLFELGKSQFGGASFESGFTQGLRTATNSAPADPNHTNGFKHAKSFVKGWTAGNRRHTTVGKNDAGAAATAKVTVPQYVYDQSMKAKMPKGEFDIWRLGYLHGRSGAALITKGADLPH